jgi:hypothetical protein
VNAKTRQALRMLQQHGDPAIGPGGGTVMSTETSKLIDGQPWVHWRTADALERAGLATVNWTAGWDGENPEITLTEKGLDA